MAALESLGYNVVGIDVGRDLTEKIGKEKIEIAFLALHGKFGEDGAIQGLLEILDIPYTGSGIMASAMGMNKIITKQIASFHGIPTPPFASFSRRDPNLETEIQRFGQQLKFPVMVKPSEEGSSLGVIKVDDPEQFPPAVTGSCREFPQVMAEEFIKGDEITVGLLETAQGIKPLPVLQLKPSGEFYDFSAKYNHGATEFILPADLPDDVTTLAQNRAKSVFRALGCRGFSRVDFIVDSTGEPWLTEINTLPGMTDTSDLPAQAKAAGIAYEELVELMLASALI